MFPTVSVRRDAAKSPIAAAKRWLLVFNCVNIGLANCLRVKAPDIEVESIDFGRFKSDSSSWLPRLSDFDLIITSPQFLQSDFAALDVAARIRVLPIIQFDAYHPDLCYVTDGRAIVKGPMGDYHSQVVMAAHARGLRLPEALKLFAGGWFERFGLLDRWNQARDRLLASFRECGLPMDRQFPTWGARGPFMHSINHPAIHVLGDIATALLQAESVKMYESPALPHDNLLNGPVYPIFPEVADRLSVRGCDRFKLPAQYRCIDLEEFVLQSYAMLDGLGGRASVHRAQRASFERILACL